MWLAVILTAGVALLGGGPVFTGLVAAGMTLATTANLTIWLVER
jgi:hypothetical protein